MISVKRMRELEKKAEKIGISRLQLMENAGKAVAELLAKDIDLSGKKIAVVCWHGNNGGDGFVAARYLARYADVRVVFLGDLEKLSEEARINYDRLLIKGIPVEREVYAISGADIVVDALLGTGIEGRLKDKLREAVEKINSSGAFIVSIDVPTGLDPDTGYPKDKTVKADVIISLHDIKRGLKKYKDKVIVADIGIPKGLK
ncbi:MAG: NAD(P)H-hydrate epimerase [Candidatus Aenigmatarchaeota archaeon]|nr:MAG: NAD(P)H-hydrate epimerase [Candidatus Aenigmarchaeota archaeon]